MNSEIRSLQSTGAELRMSQDGKKLAGVAARYNVRSKPGLGFDEIIMPGAFDRSLDAGDDVVALFNHDPNQILGRRDSGTLRITSDSEALRFEVDLPEHRSDLRELVARGDIREMSFGFVVQDDTWKNEDGQRVRHLNRVRLIDISPVVEAQYPSTSVSLRNNATMTTPNNPELFAELRNLTNQAHTILDQETRNAEDQQKLDRLFARVDEIESALNEERNSQSLAKADAMLDQPTKTFTRSAGYDSAGNRYTDRDSDEYRASFWDYVRTGDRNQAFRAMSIGNDGAVVPTDLERMLVEKMQALSIMRQVATVQNWDSNRDLPVEDALGSAAWVAEAASITPVDATFDSSSVSFRAYKGSASVSSSSEWMQDSLALTGGATNYLTTVLSKRLTNLFEAAFVNGDGSSKPTGIFQGAGVAGTTHTCGSGDVAFSNVTGDDLIDVAHALSPQYRNGAAWIMSDSMVKAVRKLKTTTGEYLWKPSDRYSDIAGGLPGSPTIYGYPVITVDDSYAPAEAASARAAVFGNMSNFWIADRGSSTVLVDPYSGAASDSVTIYINRRTDSHVILPEAFSVLKLAAS